MPPKLEVEQKYVVDNRPRLEQQLAECGFVQRHVEQHSDVYYRHPCRDFRATDEAFRLRSVNDQCCVTYKGRRHAGAIKTRPEIELGIIPGDMDGWHSLLEHLGFVSLPAVRKQRCVYTLPATADKEVVDKDVTQNDALKSANPMEEQAADDSQIMVVLDDVEQLGHFAEVELLVSDERHLESAYHRITQLAEQLGLQHVQPQSYLSQLLRKLGIE